MNETPVFSEGIKYYEEERIRMAPDLKLVTGGKEPPKTGNWLKDLEPGTIFFVQDKLNTRNPILECFRLGGKQGPNDKLVALQSSKSEDPLYVDPNRWCNLYNLYYSLGVLISPEEDKIVKEKTREGNEHDSEREMGEGRILTEE